MILVKKCQYTINVIRKDLISCQRVIFCNNAFLVFSKIIKLSKIMVFTQISDRNGSGKSPVNPSGV